MRVHILQRVHLASVGKCLAVVVDDAVDETRADPEQIGELLDARLVLVAFVAGCVRDHQRCRHIHTSHQLDCVFYALSLDYTGWLQNQQLVGRNAERFPDVVVVLVDAGWRLLELHDVRYQCAGNPGSERKLIPAGGIDDDVPNGVEVRRVALVQVVPDAVVEETFPFPEEIVMMRNGVDTRLRDELGDRHPEGDVEWNGQRVFRYEQVDLELVDKVVEALLENLPIVMQTRRQFRRTGSR